MKRNIIVTESESDQVLLEALIGHQPNIEFMTGGTWSSADSIARSLLTQPNTRVALIVDSDNSNADATEGRKRFLHQSLGEMGLSNRWHVTVIAPEIPALLFIHREIVEELLEHPISDTDFVRGQFEPRKMLAELSSGLSLVEVYRNLQNIDLTLIQNRPEIQELVKFCVRSSRKIAA